MKNERIITANVKIGPQTLILCKAVFTIQYLENKVVKDSVEVLTSFPVPTTFIWRKGDLQCTLDMNEVTKQVIELIEAEEAKAQEAVTS